MSKKLISMLVCLILLLAVFVLPASAAEAELKEFGIVGEWIHGSTVADAGEGGAEKIVSRCAEMGVTDIYLLVKGTGGTIGWLNTEFTDNLTRDTQDVLQDMIDACHSHGLRIHAWICNMEDEAYKTAHPEAGMWHYVRERDNNRINPYDEGYQEYMSKIVKELAAYDIDGIHLDYIRYNHACNGWSETDFANLEAMGANIDRVKYLIEKTFYADKLPEGESVDSNYMFDQFNAGDPDAKLIVEYRRNNVMDYAKTIISAAKEVNPDLIISAALQPETAYDEAFGGLHYGNDYDDFVEDFDYICPMAYTGDFGKDSSWMAKVAKASIDQGNKVVMGLQSYYPATSAKLMSDIEAVRELLDDETYGESILGIMHFRTTQFGYAKMSYDNNRGQMTVKTINSNTTLGYQWVIVEMQEGVTATAGKVGEGYSADTVVEVAEDGSYVKFSGENILAADSEGTLEVTYEGKIDPAQPAGLTRIYLSNESRAYNVYENATIDLEQTAKLADVTTTVGETATFTASATGDGELTYQWYTAADLKYGTNWKAIEGATDATYTIDSVALEDDGVRYYCEITDAFGNTIKTNTAKVHITLTADETNEFDIVGEWIWGSTIADAGEDGAEKIVARCAENGVTDLYLLVKGTGGTIGWLNTEFTDNLTRENRDVLQETIDAAHAKGIRVHAWICNMQDSAYKAAHPEAGMWHYVRERDNDNINPYDEGYQAYMCKVVAELAAYDIDGIHLDYIRYNHVCNGWSETDFANLEAMGADLDHVRYLMAKTFYASQLPEGETVDSTYIFKAFDEGDPDAALIFQYRQKNVMDYAEKIVAAAKAVNPDLIISAALQPETSYDQAWGGLHYGNDFADFAELCDYVCPMAYTSDFSQCSTWVARVAKAAIEKGNKVVMGLQSYYPTKSAGLMEDIAAVRSLMDTDLADSILGIAHFRTTQFGYAKVSYNTNDKTMTVKVSNPGGAYQWVRIELQEGLKLNGAYIVDGFDTSVAVLEYSNDRNYLLVKGTDVLAAGGEGTIKLSYSGDLDKTKAPALVRIYITNESRAYNVYEDVTPKARPFVDVNENDWFYNDVYAAYDAGLMIGNGNTHFSPNAGTTRAMVVMTLWRMAGSPAPTSLTSFTDVESGMWYEEAIAWAVENGIALGVGGGKFQPMEAVTREQLAAFLCRYAAYCGMDTETDATLDAFADKDQVTAYAVQDLAWCVESGLIRGRANGKLDPRTGATRAELAAVLVRAMEIIG